MKELDLLKKDWKAREDSYPKLDKEALYNLIWRRSSSIVKWLYYISIAEFVFWTALSFFTKNAETDALVKSIHLYSFINTLTVINYAVLIYFIYRFYKNYKKISYNSSSKELVESILKVKRTVTHYVWFNLSILATSLLGLFYGIIHYGPATESIFNSAAKEDNSLLFWAIIAAVCILIIGLAILLLWLFYKLLYGILLKKLKMNHKELRKLNS
ncbi:MAG: hypothetical protein ACJA1V_000761 [Flavobacteriaceae bacterium]|jgi:hypothetical protein